MRVKALIKNQAWYFFKKSFLGIPIFSLTLILFQQGRGKMKNERSLK